MIIVASPSITHVAALYAVLLGIDGEDFTVFIVRKNLPDNSLGYCYALPDNEIYIELSPKCDRIYETLAHEMVHVKQIIRKELIETSEGTVWNGKLFKNKNTATEKEYLAFPWEIEANKLEYPLYCSLRRQ